MKRTLLISIILAAMLLTACAAPAPPAEPPSTPSPTERQTYTLSTSVSPPDAGLLAPSGGEYEEGTIVTITAIANEGYAFDHWEGDAAGSDATGTLTMDSDKNAFAYFKPTESEQPKPAEFVVSNLLVIEPREGEDRYSITVDVENIGGTRGIYNLTTKYDDEEKHIVEVELNPNEKKTIVLKYLQIRVDVGATAYKMDKASKEHTISVDGLSQTITFPEPTPPAYMLQLLSASHERAYDYITMSGEVKNISSKNLENVMVVVNYYTDDGTFVKSDDALIDYNPILPGQTSPFECITTDNPAIKRFKITFKFMFGGTIPTEDIRK